MTSVVAPMCMACARLRRNDPGFTCDAFPGGYPPRSSSRAPTTGNRTRATTNFYSRWTPNGRCYLTSPACWVK